MTDRYRIRWIIIIVDSNMSRQESSDPIESMDRPKRVLWSKPWTIARTVTRESRDEIFGNFLLRFEHGLENSLYHKLWNPRLSGIRVLSPRLSRIRTLTRRFFTLTVVTNLAFNKNRIVIIRDLKFYLRGGVGKNDRFVRYESHPSEIQSLNF